MTEMLSAKDLQAILQVDRSTIYRMAESHRIPAVKVGRQWRFPGDQVKAWLKSQAVSIPSTDIWVQDVSADKPLAELVPLDCVQLIQNTFAEMLEVMLVITDLDGSPITQASQSHGLYRAFDLFPDACRNYTTAWGKLADTIDLTPQFIPGPLGALCARAMIRVGPTLKGMVIIDGVAPVDWPPTPEQIEQLAAEYGASPELLTAHINDISHPNAEQRARLLKFSQRIADIVAHIATERQKLTDKLDRLARLSTK